VASFPTKRTPDQRDRLDLLITTEVDGLSDVGDLGGLRLAGLEMSTAWTAADLGFKGSPISSANMYDIYRVADSTAPVLFQLVTTGSRLIGFNSQAFDGIRFLQLISLAAGGSTAVAQGAARTVRLLLAPPGPIK